MKILPLSIPTPFPVGPINIYLVREDPLTLIDTGPRTNEALEALRAQLRAAGLIISDIARVILTHTHEDHCGLARIIQEESGARVHVHQWEHQNISNARHNRVNQELVARTGVPGFAPITATMAALRRPEAAEPLTAATGFRATTADARWPR